MESKNEEYLLKSKCRGDKRSGKDGVKKEPKKRVEKEQDGIDEGKVLKNVAEDLVTETNLVDIGVLKKGKPIEDWEEILKEDLWFR